MKKTFGVFLAAILTATPVLGYLLLDAPRPAADKIFGQPTALTSASGTGLAELNGPRKVVFDNAGVMYVSDAGNHRVLVYAAQNDTSADTVIGVTGLSAIGDTVLNNPSGLAVWHGSDTTLLFVADQNNNRVVVFIVRRAGSSAVLNDTVADYVFGSPDLLTFTSSPVPNANVVRQPTGLAVLDTGGTAIQLFLAEPFYQRVIRWDLPKTSFGSATIDTTADEVWGQTSMTTFGSGLGDTRLSGPVDVAVSPAGDRLYIADRNNHRVLVERLDDGDTIFDRVFGQSDMFTATQASYDATALEQPNGLSLSADGSLLAIASFTSGSNLAAVHLHADTTGVDTTVDAILGDSNLVAPGFNAGGVVAETSVGGAADGMGGLFFRGTTELWAVDRAFHRVLRFDGTQTESATTLPVSTLVDPVDSTAVVNAPTATSETYLQVNLNGGGTTSGTLSSAATATGANANYACTTTLVNSGDTAGLFVYTNQTTGSIFLGLRSDTASLDPNNLPTGIPATDAGRRAFGATVILVEFANAAGRVLGDSRTTTVIGDTFAYTLVYELSRQTTALYRDLGFDTSVGSSAFGFYFADTYGGRWIRDTTVTVTVTAGSSGGGIAVRVAGITKDLPGGLGGGSSSAAGASGSSGGGCVIGRTGLLGRLLGNLRGVRDLLLTSSLGRFLSAIYYLLGI